MSEILHHHGTEGQRTAESPSAYAPIHEVVDASLRTNASKVCKLMSLLADIRAGTVGQSDVPDSVLLSNDKADRSEFDLLWQRLHCERIGIGIVLLEDAWEHVVSVSQESPTGLVEYWAASGKKIITPNMLREEAFPLGKIVDALRNMTSTALQDWQMKREAVVAEGEPLDRAFARLQAMTHFFEVNDVGMNPHQFFLSGFDTDLQSKFAFCSSLPALFLRDHQRKIDGATYIAATDANYGQLFLRPARSSRGVFQRNVSAGLVPVPTNGRTSIHYTRMLDPAQYRLDGLVVRQNEAVVAPLVSAADAARGESSLPFVCPAPFAQGVDPQKTVLREFFELFQRPNAEFCAPRFDR